MTEYYITKPELFFSIKVEEIEKKYNATWMGPWEVEGYDLPLEIFYIRKPVVVNGRLAERYVGLYFEGNQICSECCDDVFNRVLVGVAAEDGELCISRFPGDHYISRDATTWVDGGPNFLLTNRPEHTLRLYPAGDKFEIENLGLLNIETNHPVKSLFQIFKWP